MFPRASDLHVIAVISNPVRYHSRVRLFKDFIDNLMMSGVTLWIVEAVFGDRPPVVAKADHPNHILVRCDDEIWLKENLINVGARHLPPDAKYVMWLDGDVRFERDDWAVEVIENLQNYAVVQPWSHAIDYGPHHELLQTHKSFAFCHNQGPRLGPKNVLGGHRYGGPHWHPGYCFAYRMDAWNAVGGMLDRAIAGAGDHHMACGLVGKPHFSYPADRVHPNYRHMVETWGKNADRAIQRNIGYVPGTIHHAYHGKKADRRYVERWDILTQHRYDPYSDVIYDRQGVLRLNVANDDRGRGLRDGLKHYFRERREDPE